MADNVLLADSASTKTPAALIDAYQDGRLTHDELLDHLLEWRKAAPAQGSGSVACIATTPLLVISDDLSEICQLLTCMSLMGEALPDMVASDAFMRLAITIDERVRRVDDKLTTLRTGGRTHD